MSESSGVPMSRVVVIMVVVVGVTIGFGVVGARQRAAQPVWSPTAVVPTQPQVSARASTAEEVELAPPPEPERERKVLEGKLELTPLGGIIVVDQLGQQVLTLPTSEAVAATVTQVQLSKDSALVHFGDMTMITVDRATGEELASRLSLDKRYDRGEITEDSPID